MTLPCRPVRQETRGRGGGLGRRKPSSAIVASPGKTIPARDARGCLGRASSARRASSRARKSRDTIVTAVLKRGGALNGGPRFRTMPCDESLPRDEFDHVHGRLPHGLLLVVLLRFLQRR